MSVVEESIAAQLREGITHGEALIRFWRTTDDFLQLTELLHRGYKSLADRGMRFVASHQSDDITRARVEQGTTLIAIFGEAYAGTVTLYDSNTSEHFARISSGFFGQYCVEPSLRLAGLGSRMLELVEQLAIERGMISLALDTSEHATELIQFYERRGYQFVGYVRWPEVNYRSVTLKKHLQ